MEKKFLKKIITNKCEVIILTTMAQYHDKNVYIKILVKLIQKMQIMDMSLEKLYSLKDDPLIIP